jgi:DNA polymerase-3 subunit delta
MKITPQNYLNFIAKQINDYSATLIYGPNQGLSQIRKDEILAKYKAMLGTSVEVINFTYQQIKSDISQLIGAISNMSLFSKNKIISITQVEQSFDNEILDLIEKANAQIKFIIIASDLTPASKLRKTFETNNKLAAIASYEADQRTISMQISQYLRGNQLTMSKNALDYLVSIIGTDQLIVINELEKLKLTAVNNQISDDAVLSLVINNEQSDLENFASLVADKKYLQAKKAANLLTKENISEIALIRALVRYYTRLYTAKIYVEQNKITPFEASQKLKPPVFFKLQPIFLQQILKYNLNDLAKRIKSLTFLEISCKKGSVDMKFLFEKELDSMLA